MRLLPGDVADSLQTASKMVVKARRVAVVVAAVVGVAVGAEGRAEVPHVAAVVRHGEWAFLEALDEGEGCGDADERNRQVPETRQIPWRSVKLNCSG